MAFFQPQSYLLLYISSSDGMKKMKFLVIGTNIISDKFCDVVNRLSFAEIIAVYSRKIDTGRRLRKNTG